MKKKMLDLLIIIFITLVIIVSFPHLIIGAIIGLAIICYINELYNIWANYYYGYQYRLNNLERY